MGIPFDILKVRLHSVLSGAINARDLAELVHISRAITQAHLAHIRPSWNWLCQSQGISLEDLAYDCLASAFARDPSGRFLSLQSFCRSLNGSFESLSEKEVFFAYRAFLTRVADQELARLYAQADPIAGRIYRNTKDAIKKSSLFLLVHDLRGAVLKPAACDSLEHADPFPEYELRQEFVECLGRGRTLPDMVSALHTVLTGQTRYRRSLPLADATALFRQLFADEYALGPADAFPSPDAFSDSDLELIRNEVETLVRQKVLVTYVMKGKLTPGETQTILRAFHDIFDDWLTSNEPADGLMQYVKRYDPVSKEDYRRRYRTKMEYLFGIAKEAFDARLMGEV